MMSCYRQSSILTYSRLKKKKKSFEFFEHRNFCVQGVPDARGWEGWGGGVGVGSGTL